jgi:hypothetical protein
MNSNLLRSGQPIHFAQDAATGETVDVRTAPLCIVRMRTDRIQQLIARAERIGYLKGRAEISKEEAQV